MKIQSNLVRDCILKFPSIFLGFSLSFRIFTILKNYQVDLLFVAAGPRTLELSKHMIVSIRTYMHSSHLDVCHSLKLLLSAIL